MSNHDEKDEIKLAECGQAEDEVRVGKVGGGGRLVPK